MLLLVILLSASLVLKVSCVRVSLKLNQSSVHSGPTVQLTQFHARNAKAAMRVLTPDFLNAWPVIASLLASTPTKDQLTACTVRLGLNVLS